MSYYENIRPFSVVATEVMTAAGITDKDVGGTWTAHQVIVASLMGCYTKKGMRFPLRKEWEDIVVDNGKIHVGGTVIDFMS